MNVFQSIFVTQVNGIEEEYVELFIENTPKIYSVIGIWLGYSQSPHHINIGFGKQINLVVTLLCFSTFP